MDLLLCCFKIEELVLWAGTWPLSELQSKKNRTWPITRARGRSPSCYAGETPPPFIGLPARIFEKNKMKHNGSLFSNEILVPFIIGVSKSTQIKIHNKIYYIIQRIFSPYMFCGWKEILTDIMWPLCLSGRGGQQKHPRHGDNVFHIAGEELKCTHSFREFWPWKCANGRCQHNVCSMASTTAVCGNEWKWAESKEDRIIG